MVPCAERRLEILDGVCFQKSPVWRLIIKMKRFYGVIP